MPKRRRFILGVAVSLLFVAIAFSGDRTATDQYGGLTVARWNATGFFRTHFDGARWWLITPEGHPFLSIGVCSVQERGHQARGLGYAPYEQNVKRLHGTVERWKDVTRERLRSWGFNSIGGWGRKDMGLPYAAVLNFCRGHWLRGQLPDFFSKEFADGAEDVASKAATPDDRMLIGYFLDNEMQWQTDWRMGPPLFDSYMSLPPDASGKRVLVRFLQDRYGSVEELARVWGPAVKGWEELHQVGGLLFRPGQEPKAKTDREEFTLLAARQYFKTCTEALRKADPNHLILGVRFVCWTTPEVVVKACGEFCDVVSVNYYEIGPLGRVAYLLKHASDAEIVSSENAFQRFHELTRKPLMVTEFSFRAEDSGLPNSFPPPIFAQPTVPTQTDRGRKYEDCVRQWAQTNYIVGYHWFCYMDEPKEGRTLDGENGNYGLVKIDDQPYADFVKIVTSANAMFVRTRLSRKP